MGVSRHRSLAAKQQIEARMFMGKILKNGVLRKAIKTMQLNDQKAGMQGLDKEMINKIIYEASKGTPYFAFQEKRQKSIDSKVNEYRQRIARLTASERKEAMEKMDALAATLEADRDLSHSIVHIDMDAFYAAVEMQENLDLRDKPMAVGSLSMLSTSNYQARKFGVRAAMPGFIAKKLCPELVIVSHSFKKYKKVSEKVRNVVKEYDPEFCSAGLDEMYLDLTEYINKQHQRKLHNTVCVDGQTSTITYENCLTCKKKISDEERDKLACDIVQEIRGRIFLATELTASAGIAPNTRLAKVCSDQNKPNGQYQIPSTTEAVKDFISTLPVKKVSGIGPVQGQILSAIGINTCLDMWKKRELVSCLFKPTAIRFYMKVALGIGSTTVKSDYVRKSIGGEETFREISRREDLHKKCEELCNETADDLKSHNLLGKIVILKIKTTSFKTLTRNHSLTFYTSDPETIYRAAKMLLDAEIAAAAPELLKLRLMGIRMASVMEEHLVPEGERQPTKLKDFLQAKSVANKMSSPTKQTTANSQTNTEGSIKQTGDLSSETVTCTNSSTTTNTVNNTSEITNSYLCPVCGFEQNVEQLSEFNSHIDNCLSRAAIKEMLASDVSSKEKRKSDHRDNESSKKRKSGKTLDDFFHAKS